MERKPILTYVLIFAIIIAAAFGIIAFIVMNRVSTLTTESEKLVAMDIKEDQIDTNIYSYGRYGIVEAAVKTYIGNYVNDLRSFTGIPDDTNISNMLTIETIASDGPDFVNSLGYIERKRTQVDNLEEKLSAAGNEENIIGFFDAKGQNFFFDWIYRNQMLKIIGTDFFYRSDDITAAAEQIREILDKKEGILTFLKDNSDNWTIENGSITFDNEDLLNRYRDLVSQ